MKRIAYASKEHEEIFGMSNVRGKLVKVPGKLPFSFFFSGKRGSTHGIRVKPVFNPDRLAGSDLGNLELHSDWKYTPGKDDKDVSAKQIRQMKDFFRQYKVLFAAVWEEELEEDLLADYFKGSISWKDLMKEFYFYEDYSEEIDKIQDCSQLEDFVRRNNIFNMND